MSRLIALYDRLSTLLQRLDGALPLLARLTFAATLLGYFWASAMTKVGHGIFGIFHPSVGAYYQIFPKVMEQVSGDISQLSAFHWLVVTAGTLAELVLPLLIVLGLCGRLAALAMIGFIAVQSLTDIYGHMAGVEVIGRWFDRDSASLILDQRLFWVMTLLVIVVKGSGALSLDRLMAVWLRGQ
jgi:putative oxidoreductase